MVEPPSAPVEPPNPIEANPPATGTPTNGDTPTEEIKPPLESTTPPSNSQPVELVLPVESTTPSAVMKPLDIPLDFNGLKNLFTFQWGLSNSGQTVKEIDGVPGIDIRAMTAWSTTKGSPSVTVGILDTGIDISHEDLSGSVYINTGEVPENGIDDDENGYIDDVNGWDFSSNDKSVYDSEAEDTHGTHVAGIIAATENDLGITGVSPGVKILPLKFMKDSIGYTSDAIEAIQYAETLGVKIMNCSFGGPDNNYALKDAMESSGMLFICAAGNNGQNSADAPAYPASFQLGNVISVGAVDNTGNMFSDSNYGELVSLAAPGKDILSTSPGNNYSYQSGTSAAAAFVSGVAALVKSDKERIEAKALRQLLTQAVAPLETLTEKTATGGMIDAEKALSLDIPTVIEPISSRDQIESILGNSVKLSDLTPEKLDILAEFLKGDSSTLLDMDRYGFAMKDISALLIAISRCDIDLATGKSVIEVLNNPEKSLERLMEYRTEILNKNLKFESTTQLVKHVAGSEPLDKVYNALLVANALQLDLETIIRKPESTPPTNPILGDNAYILLTEEYYLDIGAITAYQVSSKLSWQQILEKVEAYQKTLNPTVRPYNDYIDKFGVNYADFLNTTFKVGQSDKESVDPVTGALKLSIPLFNIQGKTGTIPVSLQYNSDESETQKARARAEAARVTHWELSGYNLFSYWTHYEHDEKDSAGKTIGHRHNTLISGPFNSYSEAQGDYDRQWRWAQAQSYWTVGFEGVKPWANFTNSPTDTFSKKNYRIGYGWTMDLPSMELHPNEGLSDVTPYDERYWIIHTDGKQIPLRQWWTSQSKKEMLYNLQSEFSQYKMELVPATEYTNGEAEGSSHFVLKYLDGRKAYFGADGRLLCMNDAFGNRTVFKHVVTGSGLSKSVAIREIIDCYGNVTTLTYTGTGSETTVTMTLSDGSKITLNSQDNVLKNVTDQGGRVTTLDYETRTTKGAYNTAAFDRGNGCWWREYTDGTWGWWDESRGWYNGGPNPNPQSIYSTTYNLLTKVTWPTGATTSYEYNESKRINRQTTADGWAGPYEGYYPVARRYDKASLSTPVSNEMLFQCGNYTGYQDPPSGGWNNNGLQHYQDLPWYYTYATIITVPGQKETTLYFNNKHRLYNEQILDKTNGATVSTAREYNDNGDITRETVFFDGVQKGTRQYVYNDKHQCLSYTDEGGAVSTVTYQTDNSSLPAVETFPAEVGKSRVINYTISPDKKYNQSSQTVVTNASGVAETIKNETLLNPDGTRSVERTFLNGTPVFQKSYTYSYGVPDSSTNLVNRIALSTENTVQNWDSAKVVSKSKATVTEFYDFDAKNGNLLTLQMPTGKSERYEYDKLKRLTKLVNSDGTFKTIAYNDTANEVTATDESGIILRKAYDGLGNELKVFGGTLASPEMISSKTYDTNSNMITLADGNYNVTQYEYDCLGRVIKTTNPGSTATTVKYLDSASKVERVNEEGHKVTETYDLKGQKIKSETVDGLGRTITYEWSYTPSGFLKSQKDPNGFTITYTYDEMGRQISVVNPKSEVTKSYYDALGRMINLTYPDGKTLTKEYSELGQLLVDTDMAGKAKYLSYGLDGSLTKLLDRNLRVQSFTYDSKQRLSTHVGVGFSYTYNYLANDKISSVVDANYGTIGYTYFPNGRFQIKTYPDGKTLEYTYDGNGNVKSMKSPFGLTTAYSYNNRNKLSSVTANGKTFGYEYFPDGMAKRIVFPVNGLVTTYSFDNVNRLKSMYNMMGTTSLENRNYVTDLNGNITKIEGDGSAVNYTYDTLNRLLSGQTASYTYDPLGNRSTATGDASFLLASKNSTLVWNGLDQVNAYTNTPSGKPAETTTYQYDYKGMRTKKTGPAGTTKYYTDETGRVIAEADGSGVEKAQNLWSNKPLARLIAGTWYYYIYNGHGDVVKLVDDTGAVKNNYTYDEFGNLNSMSETIVNPIRYAGEYQDDESGFYHLRARYYDPVTSRFISRDTNEGKITNPLSLNLYTYCWNNPLNLVDPTGNDPEDLREREGPDPGVCISILDNYTPLAFAITGAEVGGADIPRNEIVEKIAMVSSFKGLGKELLSNGIKAVGKDIAKGGADVATSSNYRKLFIKEFPNLPSGWQVHHTLPQKYKDILKAADINIHDARYLEGIDPKIHSKITTEWAKWDKSLGHIPTTYEISKFAKVIENKYSKYLFKK